MKRLFLLAALSLPLAAVAEDSPTNVFTQEHLGDSARVTTSVKLPVSQWNNVCRAALNIPQREQLRDKLAGMLQISLPEGVSYIEAQVDNYKSWHQDKWLHCKGDVSILEEEKSLAILAVMSAWNVAGQEDKTSLEPLVRYAMHHPSSSADAVALVAHLAKPEQQLDYLNQNLNRSELRLNTAKEAVLQIWFKNKRWQDVIELAESCNTPACQQQLAQAIVEKEREDAEKADDLSSYF